jgi:hypothetical protein
VGTSKPHLTGPIRPPPVLMTHKPRMVCTFLNGLKTKQKNNTILCP